MVSELEHIRIFQQRLQRRKNPLAVQLVGRTGIVVRERHIPRTAGLDAEGDPDDARLHVVKAVGLGIKAHERRAPKAREPFIQCAL